MKTKERTTKNNAERCEGKERPSITRREFLRLGAFSVPTIFLSEGLIIEPTWLRVRKINLSDTLRTRAVHITDLHYCGNEKYLKKVITTINTLAPDFVCFTGDIVEKKRYLSSALAILAELSAPLYGVPGNHEYSSNASFAEIAQCFRSTGGAWLLDEMTAILDGKVKILGSVEQCRRVIHQKEAQGGNRILLTHYPELAGRLHGEVFTLILAGHSHGGQVRVPFLGPLILPLHVGKYDMGLFDTPSGPCYVNPGIGTYHVPLRLNCRPEITVFEL